ncbi:MAG: RDD family protein [Chloroflexi bacterium]|nr:RDD family protein [Chloroflexota bacterium]
MYGASPGKAVMGLRIVDRKTSQPAANETMVIRGLMQAFLSPVFVGAIYWWKYLDSDGLTVHDRVTQTKVLVVTNPADSPLLRMRRDLLAALGIRR